MATASKHLEKSGVQGGHLSFLAHHFDTPAQQFQSGKLGMWLFLVQEILFFSGLFVAYAVFRARHPEVFHYAHQFLDTNMGALNTAVLITSSFTMAWGVRAAQLNKRRLTVALLGATFLLAGVFLLVKYLEYSHKFHAGLLWGRHFAPHELLTGGGAHGEGGIPLPHDIKNVHIFFGIYFAMTGLHGLHVVVGMGVILWIMWRAARGDFNENYFGPVEYTGLYWHLVDLVWIYLFPLLYLIG